MILKQNSSRLRLVCSKLVLTLQYREYWQQGIRADLCHSLTRTAQLPPLAPQPRNQFPWEAPYSHISSSLLGTLCSQTSWNSILATGVTRQVSDPYKTTGKITDSCILIFIILVCNVWEEQWCQLTWQASLNRKLRTVSAWARSIGSVLPGSALGITVGTMLEPVPDAWRFLDSAFRLGSSVEGRFTPIPDVEAAIWTEPHG